MEDLVSDLDTRSRTLLLSFWEEEDSMRTFFLVLSNGKNRFQGKMMHSSPWQDLTMQTLMSCYNTSLPFLSVHNSCCSWMQHSATTGAQQVTRKLLYNCIGLSFGLDKDPWILCCSSGYFGMTTSNILKWLHFSKWVLLLTLLRIEEAKIKMPTIQQIRVFKEVIQAKYPS